MIILFVFPEVCIPVVKQVKYVLIFNLKVWDDLLHNKKMCLINFYSFVLLYIWLSCGILKKNISSSVFIVKNTQPIIWFFFVFQVAEVSPHRQYQRVTRCELFVLD